MQPTLSLRSIEVWSPAMLPCRDTTQEDVYILLKRMFCHSARNSLQKSLGKEFWKALTLQINIFFRQFLSYLLLQLLLLLLAFLPVVARAFSQSKDKIGTQLIFPILLSHLWKPKNSEVVTSLPIILFAASLLSSGIKMSLYLIPCCHFSLFSLCKTLIAHCKLGKAPGMSAVWTNCRSRLAGNKTSPRRRFNTVCMAFPLQFAITLTSKKCFTSSYIQSIVEKSICSFFSGATPRSSLTTVGKGEGGILLFRSP